jgi:hypothetical protein
MNDCQHRGRKVAGKFGGEKAQSFDAARRRANRQNVPVGHPRTPSLTPKDNGRGTTLFLPLRNRIKVLARVANPRFDALSRENRWLKTTEKTIA